MSLHRHAAKRDTNENEIMQALAYAGAAVHQISAKGVPDLLVAFRGQTFLLETKSKRGKLTPDQEAFFATWDGGKVAIVRSVDDALKAIGAIE